MTSFSRFVMAADSIRSAPNRTLSPAFSASVICVWIWVLSVSSPT